MSEIKVTLGDFTFMNMEIPSKIPLGGIQAIVEHKLVGGTKIVDVMGYFNAPLEWSGLFFGSNASVRAQYLDHLCSLGKPLLLTWAQFSFVVVIEKFHFDFERINKVPYTIACAVVTDNNRPLLEGSVYGDLGELVVADIDLADDFANELVYDEFWGFGEETPASDSISGKIAALKDTVATINNVVKATVEEINSVKDQIKSVQDTVTQQIASVSNFLQTVTTLGGILPGNKASFMADKLMRTVRNTNNMVQLMQIKNTLTVVDKNVSQVNTNGRPVISGINQTNLFALPTTQVVQNTNLYALASLYYKDPMKWTLIAKENSLQSPYITSAVTLRIPVDGNSTGGIL